LMIGKFAVASLISPAIDNLDTDNGEGSSTRL
jgi:hypothetical protein